MVGPVSRGLDTKSGAVCQGGWIRLWAPGVGPVDSRFRGNDGAG